VFEVDSLGGELAGAFETADLIARLSAEKPTLAILTDHALSAGYLLASAARQIIMPEHGRAGSIGVPEEFGNWNSIFRQFRRWADSGVWDVILESLAGSGVCDAALQMIDATVIRAHHCAAGGKGGPSATRSAVRAAASRPRSTPAPTPKGCRSAS
jgi:transposase